MLAICLAAHVVDGDTIRCRDLGRVRLLAIDSAEREDSTPCRHAYAGRICNDRRAAQSTASLRRGMAMGPVRVQAVGRDRYGRILGIVSAGGVDLSCWQLRQRQARYVARWDTGGMVARRCPGLAR